MYNVKKSCSFSILNKVLWVLLLSACNNSGGGDESSSKAATLSVRVSNLSGSLQLVSKTVSQLSSGETTVTTLLDITENGDCPIDVPLSLGSHYQIDFSSDSSRKDCLISSRAGELRQSLTQIQVDCGSPVLSVFAGVKQLQFDWLAMTGATSYTLFYDSGNGGGYSALANAITDTWFDQDVSVQQLNWVNAKYKLQACDDVLCLDSAAIDVMNLMLESIGYFKASNTESNDEFGYSLAISGDGNTLAVGAPFEDSAATGINNTNPGQEDSTAQDSGAVYVFTRIAGTWVQQAYIKPTFIDSGDAFGNALALSQDGNTLVVGAYMEDGGGKGVNNASPGAGDNNSIDAGAVYVFSRSAQAWNQQAYIKASNSFEYDQFGVSVALSSDGKTLAVGANGEDSAAIGIDSSNPGQENNALAQSGAVYVFTRGASNWAQQSYIKASNTNELDEFGISVALSSDGKTLAVGAKFEDSAATDVNNTSIGQIDNNSHNSGAVYVFNHDAVTWSQQAYIKASNTGADDEFGAAVALSSDGNVLAVGAKYEDSAATGVNDQTIGQKDESRPDSGAVYAFVRNVDVWSQQSYIKAEITHDYDYFGSAVALAYDGASLAIGASGEGSAATGINSTSPGPQDLNSGASGAAYLFVYASDWGQQSYIKAINTGDLDLFGSSVALSFDAGTLAVSARRESSAAKGINDTVVGPGDDTAQVAGAVYLY